MQKEVSENFFSWILPFTDFSHKVEHYRLEDGVEERFFEALNKGGPRLWCSWYCDRMGISNSLVWILSRWILLTGLKWLKRTKRCQHISHSWGQSLLALTNWAKANGSSNLTLNYSVKSSGPYPIKKIQQNLCCAWVATQSFPFTNA